MDRLFLSRMFLFCRAFWAKSAFIRIILAQTVMPISETSLKMAAAVYSFAVARIMHLNGFYIICRMVEKKERHEGTLALVPGVVEGPLLRAPENTDADSAYIWEGWNGVIPIPVIHNGKQFELLYGLGPVFRNAAASENIDVLLQYNVPGEPPAIIDVKIGKGSALLCGVLVHYGHEHQSKHVTRPTPLHTILNSLYRNREARRQVWNMMMERISTPVLAHL